MDSCWRACWKFRRAWSMTSMRVWEALYKVSPATSSIFRSSYLRDNRLFAAKWTPPPYPGRSHLSDARKRHEIWCFLASSEVAVQATSDIRCKIFEIIRVNRHVQFMTIVQTNGEQQASLKILTMTQGTSVLFFKWSKRWFLSFRPNCYRCFPIHPKCQLFVVRNSRREVWFTSSSLRFFLASSFRIRPGAFFWIFNCL